MSVLWHLLFVLQGMPTLSRYMGGFKRGDYVDIKADSSVQKGLPYHFYHGRTGVCYNVTKNALGVEMTKVIGNRQLRKRINVRIEHCRKSRCNEAFLRRVQENDAKKRAAKEAGETSKLSTKRVPAGAKPGFTIKAAKSVTETFAPIPYVANSF